MPEFDANDNSLVKDTVDGVLGVNVLPSVANSEEGVIGLAFLVLFDGFNVPSGVEIDSSFPVTKENRCNPLIQDIGTFYIILDVYGYTLYTLDTRFYFFPYRISPPIQCVRRRICINFCVHTARIPYKLSILPLNVYAGSIP